MTSKTRNGEFCLGSVIIAAWQCDKCGKILINLLKTAVLYHTDFQSSVHSRSTFNIAAKILITNLVIKPLFKQGQVAQNSYLLFIDFRH